MSWLGDLFHGSRPDYRYLPGVEGSINDIEGMKFGIGRPARQARKLGRRLDAGEDVSGIGTFAPIRQEEAADLSDIEMEGGYGANALHTAAGGDQAIAVRAMTDRAKENRRAQTGRQMVDAVTSLRRDLTDTEQRGIENKQAQRMWRTNLATNLRTNPTFKFDARRQGGILPGIVRGGVNALLGMATGGASTMATAGLANLGGKVAAQGARGFGYA